MEMRERDVTTAQAPRTLVAQTRRMMATDVSVQIAVEPERLASAAVALASCFAWFGEVERRLTRFDQRSELCALNRGAGAWFAASETLYAAVEAAIHAAHASDGLFNPTLLRQIEALGYDRDFALLAQTTTLPASAAPSTVAITAGLDAWREVALDPERRRIRLPAGAALDLGGIAKGWAADVALERYCQPFPGALLNVGGDVRLQGGPQPGQAWTLGLRDPRDAGGTHQRASLTFSRGALATSGAVRRWWRVDGVRRHHLLDPRTGQPLPLWTSDEAATGATPTLAQAAREPLIATVTALAPTGARAEVATKVALARGHARALAEVERAWERWGAVGPDDACDAGVALIFALSDGRILTSRNLDAWLATWGTDEATLLMYVNTQGAEPLGLEIAGTLR